MLAYKASSSHEYLLSSCMPVDRIDGAGWVMPQGVVVAKVAQLTFHATMTVASSD